MTDRKRRGFGSLRTLETEPESTGDVARMLHETREGEAMSERVVDMDAERDAQCAALADRLAGSEVDARKYQVNLWEVAAGIAYDLGARTEGRVLAMFPARPESVVKAEALRQAAAELPGGDTLEEMGYGGCEHWLVVRADRIEAGQ